MGILLGTGVGRQEIQTVLALAEAALGQGHEIRLFIMGDGVLHLLAHEANPWTEELQKLIGARVEVACCASNTTARGIAKDRLIPGVLCGSQYDHAEFVHWSERYLAFT
ncbi:MAG: DsrE family protein [Candidatus Rokubacteria bacterium]|nr:DsrE family protein [Candidatus Rokubacteria bacterium]